MDEPIKKYFDEVSSNIESLKILINTMYQELYRYSAASSNNIDVVNRIERTLNDLGKISNDVSQDSFKTNQDILNKINSATDLFINNKTKIAEDVIKTLNLDEKVEAFESKLSQIISNVKTINDNSQYITEITDKLTLSINQLNMNISLLNKSISSLGIPTNYASEVEKIVDYMISRKKGPPITFGELSMKFNQNTVKQVLMALHKLKYIEWR